MVDSVKRIAALTPVNRQTAMVAGKGVADPRPSRLSDDVEMLSKQQIEAIRAHQPFIDITGQVFGRLTVLGASVERTSAGRPWVCRCVCGRLEQFKKRTLLKHFADRCHSCDLARLSRNGGLPEKAIKSNNDERRQSPLSGWGKLRYEHRPPLQPPNNPRWNFDATGKKFGKLRVVGKSQSLRGGNNKNLLWVCICPCNYFVMRSLKNLLTMEPRLCHVCEANQI